MFRAMSVSKIIGADMAIWFSNENTRDFSAAEADINSPLRFLEIFFSETLMEKRKAGAGSVHWGYAVFIVITLLAGILLWHLLARSPVRQADILMNKKEYRNAVIFANQILVKQSDHKKMQSLAEEALLKEIMSQGWLNKLNQRHFRKARTILAKLSQEIPAVPKTAKILNALNWITDLEQYVAEREPEISVTMFQDEIPVESLLNGWRADKVEIRRVLGLIGSYADKRQLSEGDDPTYHIFNHLDMLQHTQSLYMGEVERLKRYIRKELDNDRIPAVKTALENFKRRYPGIEGVAALEEDLAAYTNLEQKIRAKDSQNLSEIRFHTPIFAQKAEQLRGLAVADTVKPADKAADIQSRADGSESISLSDMKIISQMPEDIH